ncbi:MAG: hypothetical protein WEA61_09555 [Anaerolineales bacterium]
MPFGPPAPCWLWWLPVLFLAGAIPQNFSGEAFYDFQFPYRDSFLESSRVFFLERVRSRLMHGVVISAVYDIVGFNPPAIYLSIFLMIIATAVIIAFSLKRFIHSPWVAALLVFALAWLPLNITDLMALKKAHHVFAWFLFWLAVLLFQRWVVNKRLPWLFGATFSFICSVLAYEATIGLFPIAVFLSVHYIKDPKDWLNKLALTAWISMLAAFAFLNLEAIKPFSGVETMYSGSLFDASQILQTAATLLPQFPDAIFSGALFGEMSSTPLLLPISQIISIGILVLLFLILWTAVSREKRGRAGKPETLALCVAGAWLALFTYAPFLLAGQPPDSDSLRGFAFGMFLIALGGALFLQQPRGRAWRSSAILAAVCGFWIMAGGLAYAQGVKTARQQDLILRNFVISLKAQVPDVAYGTQFVFVNASLGRTGCIGALNMLYDHNELQCIHLLDGDTQETYTRLPDGLLETGGRLKREYFIILTFDQLGNVTLIDEFGPENYPDLPITWESTETLRTDFRLILPQAEGKNLDFYNYIVSHR